MALLNRDKDPSEQRDWLSWSSMGLSFGASYGGPGGLGVGGVATGQTLYLWGPMPYPFVVQSANAAAPNGYSNIMQLAFSICRMTTGGVTVIGIGISNLVVAVGASFSGFGSSGPYSLGYSGLAAAGSTLLQGQRGDVILATTAVSSTACQPLMINMVVQKVQDTVSMDGV